MKKKKIKSKHYTLEELQKIAKSGRYTLEELREIAKKEGRDIDTEGFIVTIGLTPVERKYEIVKLSLIYLFIAFCLFLLMFYFNKSCSERLVPYNLMQESFIQYTK